MFKKLKKTRQDFKFNESENVACVVCDHIVNKQRDIHYVTHDLEEGQWCFLCGKDDHEMKNYMLISLKHVIEIDKSVNDLYKMPLGFGAVRLSINQNWKLFKQEE